MASERSRQPMSQSGQNLKRKLGILRVRALPTSRTRGILTVGGVAYPCVLGRSGIVATRRGGGGGPPRGRLPLGAAFTRADKAPRIKCLLATRSTRLDDAWCDDPADRRYNRLIK